MNELLLQNNVPMIESREVAEMIEVTHASLLKKVRNYEEILLKSKLTSVEFFIPSEYKDSTGRTLKCYLLTKKGCEMVANKLTGEKGVLFTAKYVSRFEEMEKAIQNKAPSLPKNYLEALKELVKQVEENELLREENKQLKALRELEEISASVENKMNELHLYSTDQIAKSNGMTAIALYKFLNAHKVCYRRRGRWHIYYAHKHQNLIKRPNGHMKWTEKGKKYIEKLLNEN